MLGSDTPRPNELSFRSPDWSRDLALGLLLGGSLIWALSDTTFHWETFKTHAFAELVCVATPLGLALLSPRRILAVFLGLSIVSFRLMFLIFLFHDIKSTLATLTLLVLLIFLGHAANRRYKLEQMQLPEGFTVVEFFLTGLVVSGGFYLLYLLRRSLGIG
jgi:hypothetical protein